MLDASRVVRRPRCCCRWSSRSVASHRNSASKPDWPAGAGGDGKPIQGLETAEQQFAVLSGCRLRSRSASADDARGIDAARCPVDELVGAWQAGDTTHWRACCPMNSKISRSCTGRSTEDRTGLGRATRRPARRPRRLLVVVGALHLVGRNSVVDLLRQRGYTVTQQ